MPAFLAERSESGGFLGTQVRVLGRDIPQGRKLPSSGTSFVLPATRKSLTAEAVEWGRRFKQSGSIELIRVDPQVEDEAWAILDSQEDKSYSYVDATSFALMEKEGCEEACLDKYFRQRGLGVLPR